MASFDTLNRTIEGLEARIEGLMARQTATTGRAGRHMPPAQQRPSRTRDVVSEIVDRQRLLDEEREAARPRGGQQRAAAAGGSYAAYAPAEMPAPAPAQPDFSVSDITNAIASLRDDLRRDMSEGIAREMASLREEFGATLARNGNEPMAAEMRDDLSRIAASIEQLDGRPENDGLRVEFDELRAMIDGLAKKDSIDALEARWGGVEEKLTEFDPKSMRDDIVNLAYRLDDIRESIGELPATFPVEALETRLDSLAGAIETLAERSVSGDAAALPQFEQLEERLDEISRAIASLGSAAARGQETELLNRLEARLTSVAEQIETSAHSDPSEEIGARLQALADRIDEIANVEAVARLEERLDQLGQMIETGLAQQAEAPFLVDHLSNLTTKIDELEAGANDGLVRRIEDLAHRIDAIAEMPRESSSVDEGIVNRLDTLLTRAESAEPRGEVVMPPLDALENRLAEIARRLDETLGAPGDDTAALKNLEAQIANLSQLVSTPVQGPAEAPSTSNLENVLDARLSAIEEHLSTSDEYVIEAARQAAEAVVEAYGPRASSAGGEAAADHAAIAQLAGDLRAIGEHNRSSEERSVRTFEAVHETLLKIADRLEALDRPAMPRADTVVHDHGAHDDENVTHPAAGPVGPRDSISPAEAAARAAEFASHEEMPSEEPAEEGEKRSLFASLGRRMSGKRKDPVMRVEPGDDLTDVGEAPSLDAADAYDDPMSNEPLEPGSGNPDIGRIMQKVREAQAAERSGDADTRTEEKSSSFIAAARRAAEAAAAEVETVDRGAGKTGKKSGGGVIKRNRRALLMAAGVVLLAVMTWPLVSNFIGGGQSDVTVAEFSEPPAMAESAQAPDVSDIDTAGAPVISEADGADAAPALPEVRLVENDDGSDGAEAPMVADAPMTADMSEPSDPAQDEVASLTPETGDTSQPVVESASLDIPEEIGPATLRDAAAKGEPLALFEIGARYTDGRGVEVDLAKAAQWYERSAELGFAPAQYRLANLYEKGTGVERDLEKAKTWYQMAAEQGNASAMHNLAVLFAMGRGGSPDFESAGRWFIEAAEHGVRDSQFNLGILYVQGNGVDRDLEESYKWFAVAAQDGDRDAIAKRDQVAESMRPEQLTRARAKVDLWRPKPLDSAANTVVVPPEWGGTDTRTASVDMSKAIRNIQAILNNNGFDAGPPDGIMGAKTVAAIKAFQKSIGREPTGEIDDVLVRELLERNG